MASKMQHRTGMSIKVEVGSADIGMQMDSLDKNTKIILQLLTYNIT